MHAHSHVGIGDHITQALRSIECTLRGLDPVEPSEGAAFAVHNLDSGECCGTGLGREHAITEARRMSREYDAMILLVRAYVDGEASGYHVRAAAPVEAESC
jgi:hypothetical protein